MMTWRLTRLLLWWRLVQGHVSCAVHVYVVMSDVFNAIFCLVNFKKKIEIRLVWVICGRRHF